MINNLQFRNIRRSEHEQDTMRLILTKDEKMKKVCGKMAANPTISTMSKNDKCCSTDV
jgi:hypothetical protein